jgi:hypothetical protein
MANIVKSIEDAARTLGMQLQLVAGRRSRRYHKRILHDGRRGRAVKRTLRCMRAAELLEQSTSKQ